MGTNTKKPENPSRPVRSRSQESSDKRSVGTSHLVEENSTDMKATDTQLKSHGSPLLTPTLTQEELQFVLNAKASGKFSNLMEAAKTFSTGVSLDEINASANDHKEYVESLSKKASAIQSNLDRCRNLIESSDQSKNDRIGAKHSKLNSLKAAKARLEEMATTDDLELKQSVPQNIAHLEKLACDPGYLNGRMSNVRDKSSDLPIFIANDHFFDNLLDKLQALGWEIKVTDDNKSLVKAARYYSSLEVMLSIVACKRTLNTVLKEALEKYPSIRPAESSHARALDAEIQAAKEEIDSLWDEVVPVAHMATEKTLLEPILKQLNLKEKSHKYQNAIIGSYIGSCLSFMNERLELLASRVGAAVYHHLALSIAYEYRRSLHAEKKADLRYVDTKGYITDSANVWHDPKDATTLLSHIRQGMEVYGGFPSKAFDLFTTGTKKATIIDEFMAKRATKDKERFKNLHGLFETAVKASLNEGSDTNTDVLECLLADSLKGSGYEGAALRDGQTEESLEALENENNEIKVLLEMLHIPQVQLNRILRPAHKRILGSLAMHRVGVAIPGVCQDGHAADNLEECAGFKIALKGLEVIQRWSELIDAAKE